MSCRCYLTVHHLEIKMQAAMQQQQRLCVCWCPSMSSLLLSVFIWSFPCQKFWPWWKNKTKQQQQKKKIIKKMHYRHVCSPCAWTLWSGNAERSWGQVTTMTKARWYCAIRMVHAAQEKEGLRKGFYPELQYKAYCIHQWHGSLTLLNAWVLLTAPESRDRAAASKSKW